MKEFYIFGFIVLLENLSFTSADEFERNLQSFNGEFNKSEISATEDIKDIAENRAENLKTLDDNLETHEERLTEHTTIDNEGQSNFSNVDLNHIEVNSKNEILNDVNINRGETAEVPNIMKEEIIKQYLLNEIRNPPRSSENVQEDEKQKVIRHLLSNVLGMSEDYNKLTHGDQLSDKPKLDEQEANKIEDVSHRASLNDLSQWKNTNKDLDNLIEGGALVNHDIKLKKDLIDMETIHSNSSSGEERKISDDKVSSTLDNRNFEELQKDMNNFKKEKSNLDNEVQEKNFSIDEISSNNTKEESTMSSQIDPAEKDAVDLNGTSINLNRETVEYETTHPLPTAGMSDFSNSKNTPDTLVAVPNNLNNMLGDHLNKSRPDVETLSKGLPELTIEQVNSMSDQDMIIKLEENQKVNTSMLLGLTDPKVMHEILSSPQQIPYIESNPLNVSSTDSANSSDAQMNGTHFALPVTELLESNPFSGDKGTGELDPRILKSMSDAELQVALIVLLASMNPSESNRVILSPTGYGTFLTYINDIDLNVELVPIQSSPITRKKAKDYFKHFSKALNKIHSKMPLGMDEVVKAIISASVPGGSEAIVAGEFIANVMKQREENIKKKE